MFKNLIVLARILIVVMMTAGLLTSCKKGFEDARTDMSQRGDADVSAADGKEQTPADDAADVATSRQSPVGDSSDPQTNVFWKLGYNEVRSDAPIHIHRSVNTRVVRPYELHTKFDLVPLSPSSRWD